RPRLRLPGSGSRRSVSPGITQSFFSQNLNDRDFERLRLVGSLGGETLQLDRETRDVDAVAYGVALIGRVRHLEEIRDVIQDALFGKGKVLLQDVKLLVALRKVDENLRLETGMNVFGQLEGGGVVVHRGNHPEIRMRLDLDAGHHGL